MVDHSTNSQKSPPKPEVRHPSRSLPHPGGSYEVTLTVADSYGDEASANAATFTVGNLQLVPTATITAPSTATVGSSATLTGTANPTSPSESYAWTIFDSGNGTTTTASGQTYNFTPSVAGVYAVTLEVTGASGVPGWATTDITVTGSGMG